MSSLKDISKVVRWRREDGNLMEQDRENGADVEQYHSMISSRSFFFELWPPDVGVVGNKPQQLMNLCPTICTISAFAEGVAFLLGLSHSFLVLMLM